MYNFLLRNVMWFQKQPPLFVKVSQIPQENTCAEVSFKKKLQACKPISCFFSLYPAIHANYVKSYCLHKSLSK